MRTLTLVLVVVAAALAGFAAGRSLPRDDGGEARAALEAVERQRDEALAAVQKAQAALAAERRVRAQGAPSPEPVAGPAPPPAEPAAAAADPAAAAPSEEQRRRDVRDLVARIDGLFEKCDGEGALEVLRRLAALVPEGRAAAMDLAVRLNEDVNGDGLLRLDQYTFYTSLGDTAVRDLMLWSMEHESPADFRVLAAYSVPWVVPKDRAIEVLVASLAREKDVVVQQAAVVNLAQMRDARAGKALAALLADRSGDAGVRAQVATSLGANDDPELARALESAAGSDPDDAVRAAARAALTARNPPVDGYLVTIVFPGGAAAAAGLRPGDILVSVDGSPARDPREIRAAMDAATADTAALVVLRDGSEVALRIARGRMGIQGRAVRRR